MRLKEYLFALCLPATLTIGGVRATAQANVLENQTTYIYADAQAGSDSNTGLQSSPFKTVQAAINKASVLNQQGVGVKVIVNPGVYREAVTIGNYKATGATLTLQAAVTGTAIIAGSTVLSGWTQQNATTYQTAWTYNLGLCALPSGWPTTYAPIVQRPEMVFVNGTPLTQVLSFNDMRPGTFYVSNQYALMHVAPPAGTNMATAVVEAAIRPQTLSIAGRSNVVVRGLVFRHAANCLNTSGVSISGSTNVLVDSVQALWNNWGGLGVFSSNNITVQNSVASYNGGVGIHGRPGSKRPVQL